MAKQNTYSGQSTFGSTWIEVPLNDTLLLQATNLPVRVFIGHGTPDDTKSIGLAAGAVMNIDHAIIGKVWIKSTGGDTIVEWVVS